MLLRAEADTNKIGYWGGNLFLFFGAGALFARGLPEHESDMYLGSREKNSGSGSLSVAELYYIPLA